MVQLSALNLASFLLLISGAAAWTHGHYHPQSLGMALIAAFLAWRHFLRASTPLTTEQSSSNTRAHTHRWFLGLGVLWVAWGALNPGLIYPTSPNALRLFQSGWLPGGILWSLLFYKGWNENRLSKPIARALRLLSAALLISVVWVSPHPHIDVFTFLTEGAQVLKSGRNPYEHTFTNIYGGTSPFYPHGGIPDAFPYFPANLLLALLPWDVRITHAIGLVFFAWTLEHLGKKNQTSTASSFTLAWSWIWMKATPFFVEQTWTDAVSLAALGALVCIAQSNKATQLQKGWASGILLATKQTLWGFTPWIFALLIPAPGPNQKNIQTFAVTVVSALLISTLTLLPFFLWNPGQFIYDTFGFHSLTPYRTDGLTLTSLILKRGGPTLPQWVTPGALAVGLGLFLARTRKKGLNPSTILWAWVAVQLSVLLVSKHAFCNYYFFVLGLGLLATQVTQHVAVTQQSRS